MENERLVGILSERDYARKVILKGKMSRETRISEIMSSPVTVITPDCTVDEAMSVMTQKHFRHLPVQRGEQVIGVVSIGDLVKAIISDQAETIEHLNAYIAGQYPG
jgi:CBS domain-containing protein